ncbi:hypothetical protein CQ018_19405 [Arthrobacter sp. MYb227]|uniref:MepB family protein n=1 Tax=Arthrobacter sp. MYb227 TaxID=1848601 RepID=UPI000CFCBD50|nr:MepB family protein [Arthrobacter sp. MYb227]PQZ85949.1 hypothetical protein CQ018_19405 [Arthrobacter sp. MYb227]
MHQNYPFSVGMPRVLAEVLGSSQLAAGRTVSDFALDPNPEARAYTGCEFSLTNDSGSIARIVFRSAKVTPTKAGLFVTLWKRDSAGVTRPYTAADSIDEFWISAETERGYGVFRFAADALENFGVLRSTKKPGKRGFRLYTPWDENLNSSATKAWAWQHKFFTVLER